ncbi:MAG TPA: tyrosine-type recombinase/integrase, partial [Nitrospiraceae bacterium]
MSAESRLRFNKRSLEHLPLPQPGSRFTFHDSEVPGLQLRVTDRGTKSFCVFRRSKHGAPERITIGRFPSLSVERARVKARRYLADLGEGVSVVAQQRNAALEGRTLDDVHREYLASRGVTLVTIQRKDGKSIEQPQLSPYTKLKASTARDYVTAIEKKFADWITKPLASITRDMVEERHRMLTERSPAEANRAMRYLRALFVFASDYRDSEGQPVIPDNPVRRLSAKRLWNRIERRTQYIEPEQLSPWWQAVQSLENKAQYPSREANRDYLVLLLLTGLRRTEALRLRWENVNLKVGTLCAVDTKNRSDHVLPMGRYLWELMRRRRRASDSDWVFANPLTGSRITDPHRQVVNVVARSGVPFSPHDLRRTFASIVSRLGDRLSYYTTKRLLNHRTSDVTQGYVQFDLEQLRSAMQA